MAGIFPFGQPVKKVEQFNRSPKKVFILGVYASAVHATWKNTNGKTLINALAVASEPYIFWKGDCAELIIKQIKLPKDAGNLFPAVDKFNGPSGRALDTEYLIPLGLTREDCWLCDLVPYSMLNPSQQKAIDRNKVLFENHNLKLPDMIPASLANRRIEKSRVTEIVGEIEESKAEYLITLGNEPIKNFVKIFNPEIKLLDSTDTYGNIQDILIDGVPMKLIALVHPRQAGKLGTHSRKWSELHNRWNKAATKNRKLLL